MNICCVAYCRSTRLPPRATMQAQHLPASMGEEAVCLVVEGRRAAICRALMARIACFEELVQLGRGARGVVLRSIDKCAVERQGAAVRIGAGQAL